jgi:DNA-binding transcriptional LysR family regulator
MSPSGSLVAIPVGRVRRVVCASTQYLRRHGVPRVPDDIRRHNCVRHIGLVPRSEWHFRVGKRQVTVPIASIMTCNETESAINACIDGLGLGMFLSYMVAPYRKAGQLKYVLEKFETEPMPVQVVYPQPRLMSHKVRTFVDECIDKLRHTAFD